MLTSVVEVGDRGKGCCDTGADVNLITQRALEFDCVKVIREHDIDVKLSFVDGSTATAKREIFCEITDNKGRKRSDWFIKQEMDDVDILFGVTFMDGRNTEFNSARGLITTWDWTGSPFELRMERRSRDSSRTKSRKLQALGQRRVNCKQKDFRRVLRVAKSVDLGPGWNQITQDELGINLTGQALVTESVRLRLGMKGLSIPNQIFNDADTPVNIFSVVQTEIPSRVLLGRVDPQPKLLRDLNGKENPAWDVQRMFRQMLKEEIANLNEGVIDEPTQDAPSGDEGGDFPSGDEGDGDGADLADEELSSDDEDNLQPKPVRRMGLNPAEEDPPVQFKDEDVVEDGKHWKTLLNRDPTLDPQYRVVTDEEFNVIWKELKLDSNTVFEKEMNDEERGQLTSVLKAYAHVMAKEVQPIDKSVGEHAIPLQPGAVPVSSYQYSLRPENQESVREFVKTMLKAGLIKKCSSPWNSPLLVTPKADGTPRICFDARKLNAVTIKDQYPVSSAQLCLRRLRGSSLFSTGDMLSGFWQIPLRLEDQLKTAFSTEDGQFCFTVMPFGLANASNCFCRVMSDIVGELKHLFCILYIDDFLLNYREHVDAEEGRSEFAVHIEQIEAMLAALSIAGMSLKATKLHLLRRIVKFLGHLVDRHGLKMDPEKVASIVNAKVPTTKRGVRAWIGIVNYYRHFVKNIGKILHPLYELLKKKAKWKCEIPNGSRAYKAIQLIKRLLTHEPIVLSHPDFTKDFEIQTDGSIAGLGAVLVQYEDAKNEKGEVILEADGKPKQVERVVEYASKALNDAERNYTARELEALALLFACRKWHAYLGRKFTAVVDHKNLLQLQDYVKHNRRLARWATGLSPYDIELKYRKGEDHVPPDFLSRLPTFTNDGPAEGDPVIRIVSRKIFNIQREESVVHEHDPGNRRGKKVYVKLNQTPEITRELIYDAQREDQAWRQIADDLEKPERLRKLHHSHLYRLDEDGVLLFDGVKAKGDADLDPDINKINNRIVIPEVLRDAVLWHYHDHILQQHRSARAMYEDMAILYFWPAMQYDIKDYCKSCPDCAKAKVRKKSRSDRLKSMLNRIPFSVLFLDHVEIPAKNKWNYTHILTMMCGFTKFLIAVPVTSVESGTSCKEVFDRVVCGLGRLPQITVVDNGFDSTEWRAFCKGIGSSPIPTTPFNPRANQVERPHSFLKALIKINAEAMGQDVWPQLIQAEVRAYNSLKGPDKLSPMEVLFGFQPDLPIERLLFPTTKSLVERTREQFHGYLLEELRRNHRTQRFDHLAKADSRVMQAIRDPKRFAPPFGVGDWVLVEQARFGMRKKGTATKCFYQCTGPHKIVAKREGADIYEIQIGDTNLRKQVPGVRLRLVPIAVRNPPKAILSWAVNEANNMVACHSIGDIVAFKPPTTSEYGNCNVQLAEIVKIFSRKDEQVVEVHLYGPDIQGTRDYFAHKRAWYPLVRSEQGGIELQKVRTKRRVTRSSLSGRYTKELKVEDILPIPAIELGEGNLIDKEDRERIRKALKQGEPEDVVVRKKKKEYVKRNPREDWWYMRRLVVEHKMKSWSRANDMIRARAIRVAQIGAKRLEPGHYIRDLVERRRWREYVTGN